MPLTLLGVTDTLFDDDEKYSAALEAAGNAFEEMYQIFESKEFEDKKGWKKDCEGANGEIVYSKSDARGKLLTAKTELPVSHEIVFDDIWNGLSIMGEWNPNILSAEELVAPTKHFQIVHYINKDMFIISGRDFLVARVWRELPDGYQVSVRSVTLPECPELPDKVRGEVFLGGFRVRKSPSNPGNAICESLLLSDPKGSIPKFLLNPILPKILLADAEASRNHLIQLGNK